MEYDKAYFYSIYSKQLTKLLKIFMRGSKSTNEERTSKEITKYIPHILRGNDTQKLSCFDEYKSTLYLLNTFVVFKLWLENLLTFSKIHSDPTLKSEYFKVE